jgi:hypothetical protein
VCGKLDQPRDNFARIVAVSTNNWYVNNRSIEIIDKLDAGLFF